MNNRNEKNEGTAESIGGTVKQSFGKYASDEQMAPENRAKEPRGEAHRETTETTERPKGKADEFGGATENHIGHITENKETADEGKTSERRVREQRDLNR